MTKQHWHVRASHICSEAAGPHTTYDATYANQTLAIRQYRILESGQCRLTPDMVTTFECNREYRDCVEAT